MFDQVFYNNILQAAHQFLQNNLARVGGQFAQQFMQNFTPSNGNQQTLANAQGLNNYVIQYAQSINPGNPSPGLTSDQMFQVVGNFISEVYNRNVPQQTMQSSAFGGFGQNGFQGGGGNGMFGGSTYSQPQAQRTMFSGAQPQRIQPGSHLSDDLPQRTATPTPTPSPTTSGKVEVAPINFTPVPKTNYVDNPLDSLPEDGVEFSPVNGKSDWNGRKPKDNRIILGERTDLKTRDAQFTVQATRAYHREILDDPMQVLRDFFDIVPDSVLGSVFLYSINYNHLDILDVPTADFINVRNKCIEAVRSDSGTLIHKQLLNQLKSMTVGPYQALTAYLVKHINRALYLAARLSNKPEGSIQISSIEDIDDLLSSTFMHPIVLLTEGRYRLETIVSNAIWNVLVKNVGVMFEDDDVIPTHAIQSSPAFPYSIEGVYPNKFAIPSTDSPDAAEFLTRMKERELIGKTYLLSRQRVVVTNVLNKTVLPSIDIKPKLISTPVAPLLYMSRCNIPFADPKQLNAKSDAVPVEAYASEVHPADQYQQFIGDPTTDFEQNVERFSLMYTTDFPVDQTIFAVQYGVDPKVFLEAIDVFTSVDDMKSAGMIILAKKTVKALHTTE